MFTAPSDSVGLDYPDPLEHGKEEGGAEPEHQHAIHRLERPMSFQCFSRGGLSDPRVVIAPRENV